MWQRIALVMCLCVLQTACLNAAYTGAQIIYDRNQLIHDWKNHSITFQANQIFREERNYYPRTRISVSSFNYDVLMVGQTPTEALKQQAEKSVRRIAGIKRLFNRIEVSPPISGLEQSADTWITAKIRSRIIADNEVNPRELKIITEHGVVYLLGNLKPEHAKIALYIATHTHGVRQVVPLFRTVYIR
jgi:osmotically-inducible protein OsmY